MKTLLTLIVAALLGASTVTFVAANEPVAFETWSNSFKFLAPIDPNQFRENGDVSFITFHQTDSRAGDGSRESEIESLTDFVLWNHAYEWIANKPKKTEGRYGHVAYHYLIGNSGTVYIGRPESFAPASGTYYYDLSNPDVKHTYELSTGRIVTPSLQSSFLSLRDEALENWMKTGFASWESATKKFIAESGLRGSKAEEAFSNALAEAKKEVVAPGNSKGHVTIAFICKSEPISEKAKESAARLCATLLKKYNLGTERIRVHREVSTSTTCPGASVYTWVRGEADPKGPTKVGPGIYKIRWYLKNGIAQ